MIESQPWGWLFFVNGGGGDLSMRYLDYVELCHDSG